MTDSYDDWHQDYLLQGSDIIVDDPAISHVLDSSGLLLDQQLALHNVQISQPALSLNGGEEIVYFVARKNYRHPGAWILAVDMKNGKLQAVNKFGDQRQLDSEVIYCPSIISKYMDAATTTGFQFPFSSNETRKEQLHIELKSIPNLSSSRFPTGAEVHEIRDDMEGGGDGRVIGSIPSNYHLHRRGGRSGRGRATCAYGGGDSGFFKHAIESTP
uniref:DUF1618 domain-containing protein n=1 Tax=Leersia perrieri TaxID=77586 RepID=A0A0D9XSQ9_9ORYZ